jgi:hypothetical protein
MKKIKDHKTEKMFKEQEKMFMKNLENISTMAPRGTSRNTQTMYRRGNRSTKVTVTKIAK